MADITKRCTTVFLLASRDRLQPIHSQNLVQVVGAIAVAWVMCHLPSSSIYASGSDKSTVRPNIILIMADDK